MRDKRWMRRPVMVGLVTCLALAGTVEARGDENVAPGQTYPTSKSETVECNDDGSHAITYEGPSTLWPPNHKYHSLTITARGHQNDDVTISSAGSHDEPGLNGAGNTAEDVKPPAAMASGQGSASVTHEIRSERSGRGDGRVYTFNVTATFSDDPTPCTATFTATVPHDMRPDNRTP